MNGHVIVGTLVFQRDSIVKRVSTVLAIITFMLSIAVNGTRRRVRLHDFPPHPGLLRYGTVSAPVIVRGAILMQANNCEEQKYEYQKNAYV